MPAVPTAVPTPLTARIAVRARRSRYLLPLTVCVLYAVFQLVAAPQWTMFPDSYRYARAAEQYLGVSREEAHRTALAAFCVSRADRAAHDERLQPMVHESRDALSAAAERACLKRWIDAPDITTADPRYQAIFSGRPGYPLLAAPFVGAFGVLDGMRLLGVLLAAGGSLLVFGLLGCAGLTGVPPPSARWRSLPHRSAGGAPRLWARGCSRCASCACSGAVCCCSGAGPW